MAAREEDLPAIFARLGIDPAGEIASALRAMAEARRKSEQEAFLVKMLAIVAPSSADTSMHVYEHRPGAPPALTVDPAQFFDLVRSEEAPPSAVVERAWQRFGQAVNSATWPLVAGDAKVRENSHIHPVIAWALDSCLSGVDDIRMIRNKVMPDDVAVAEAQPDFSVVHARDSLPSLLGAAFTLEVALPGDLERAARQAHAYGRGRVYKLLTEALNRGETGHTIAAVVAGTDGRCITLSAVMSGAPPPGGEWRDHKPCPTFRTDPLKLLAGWDGASKPDLPAAPPAGFQALLRVLHARGSALMMQAEGAPLTSLRVCWAGGADGAEAGTDGGGGVSVVALGDCLGRGGTSDVYGLDGGSVIKLGRCATSGLAAAYAREEAALTTLRRDAPPPEEGVAAGPVDPIPRIERAGDRALGVERSPPSTAWRVLQLAPRGEPLLAWLTRKARAVEAEALAGGAGQAAARALRRAWLRGTATSVTARVLDALERAHDAGIVHCDVRPANVVMAGDHAVLADWGESRSVGDEASGVGVPSFAAPGVFTQSSYTARPLQDIVPAALLWLAVAAGSGRAPWQHYSCCDHDETAALRLAWLKDAANGGGYEEGVRLVAVFVLEATGERERPRKSAQIPLLQCLRHTLQRVPSAPLQQ